MIDRLPTPWGLVRLGVAPDHPKLKTVSRAFERIADKPGFRFLGNVEVGRDLHHDDLVRLYDAVLYAVGAQTDRRLGIPGEDLPGSWSAFEFVAWYNGHPDYQGLPFDLDTERAVVVGNGNVALDVARMLALAPEELAPTDTTDAAIEAITALAARGDRRPRPARPGAGVLHAARARGAGRPRGRRRGRRSEGARAGRGERRARGARQPRPAQHGGAEELRRPGARGEAPRAAAALPGHSGRYPRRATASRRSRSCATVSKRRTAAWSRFRRKTRPHGIVSSSSVGTATRRPSCVPRAGCARSRPPRRGRSPWIATASGQEAQAQPSACPWTPARRSRSAPPCFAARACRRSACAALAASSSRSAGSTTTSAPASSASSASSGGVKAASAGPRRPSTTISSIPAP